MVGGRLIGSGEHSLIPGDEWRQPNRCKGFEAFGCVWSPSVFGDNDPGRPARIVDAGHPVIAESNALIRYSNQMNPVSRLKRRVRAVAQAAALMMLVCAMIAPKVSLALVTVFGSSQSSVVICTGGGLKRVAVSSDGQIVDDASDEEAWVSPHCALPDERTSALERAWHRVNFPQFAPVASFSVVDSIRPPNLVRPGVTSRGPPAS